MDTKKLKNISLVLTIILSIILIIFVSGFLWCDLMRFMKTGSFCIS